MTPPWVEYPGFSPGDAFWRQSGETWLRENWQPFWRGLTGEEQRAYLNRWNAPPVWRLFCTGAVERWLDEAGE